MKDDARPDEVLDTIEHALRDWQTSADAMRWNPNPHTPPSRAARLKARTKGKLAFWFSWWRIADALNHLKRTCWCDLVSWVQYEKDGSEEDEYHTLRSALSGGEGCRKRTLEPGQCQSCYCGKFTRGRVTPTDWTPS